MLDLFCILVRVLIFVPAGLCILAVVSIIAFFGSIGVGIASLVVNHQITRDRELLTRKQ